MPSESANQPPELPPEADGIRVGRLAVEDFRNIESLTLEPTGGLNGIIGPNGAGKTSILECLFLLGRGRSFRPGRVSQLVREGRGQYEIRGVVWHGKSGHRIGLRNGGRERTCRVDGEPVDSLAELAPVLPVLVFEPHAHELVEGGPENRRRFLDWGVFHVEQDFLRSWRRYRRALRQRNAALRDRDGRTAASWEAEMGETGASVASMRERYSVRLAARLQETLGRIAPELADIDIAFRPGWDRGQDLGRAVAAARDQDMRLGFTHFGPHRDDLRISLSGRQAARRLSRGQEKLVALGLVLSQAWLFREDSGDTPVLLMDDLPSELDAEHLARSVEALAGLGGQTFVTAVADPAAFEAWPGPSRWFHVEQGQLAQVV